MAFDPWASYNAGMQNLGQTFDTMREEQRQAPLRALQLRILQQKADEGNLALQEAQTNAANRLALRNKLASAQPVTTTEITPPTKAAATLSRLPSYMQSQGDFTMPQEPASPIVQAYNEGRVKTTTQQPDLAAIAREELLRQGNIEGAAKVGQLQIQSFDVDNKLAEMKAKVLAGGGDPAQYAQAKLQLDIGKEVIGTIGPLMKTQQGRAMASSLLDGYKKAYPNIPAIQGMTLDNFSSGPQGDVYNVHDPSNGQLIGHYVRDPETGNLKFEKSSAGEYANTDFGTFKNGFKQEHPQATDADISRAWEAKQLARAQAQRQIVVNNPMPAKVNVNQLEPEEQAAINGAIGAGKIDPYRINSRNQKALAQAIIANPDVDLNDLAARMGLARNAKVQDKAGNAAILPDLINDVKESGKKLNYSNFAVKGKAEQWWDKMTNNPNYINYSAKRNDIIMRIGGVMRENGMTDQAQKLEEDSAPRSMSPPAFDAWAQAQMAVLKPIMNKYISQAKGKGTPLGGASNAGKPSLDQIFK